MQVEFIVNGGVQLLLCPETAAEIALLKQMMKQENELTEIRGQVQVLTKAFRDGGLLISQKPPSSKKGIEEPKEGKDTPEKEEPLDETKT